MQMRVATLASFSAGSEIACVSHTPDRLVVNLGVGPSLIFEDVIGFRLLDEGDLLEFWPECSAEHGGLFKIVQGGWLSQESTRAGFRSADRAGLNEFFVTGPNACVNVLGFGEPQFEVEPS
jgi:hypothetical protein